MARRIIPRDQVAHELAITLRVLIRYQELGPVRAVEIGAEVDYGPAAEIRRLVIVNLHDRLLEVQGHVHNLDVQLRDLVDTDNSSTTTDSHERG